MEITSYLKLFVGVLVLLQNGDACRTGYTQFENACYHLSHDKENWVDAMTICKAVGGHLAEIDSAKENDFLKSLVLSQNSVGEFWIGANDMDVEGRWIWWDSDIPFAYSNWRPGEPNNDKSEEDCMVLVNTGNWNDVACSSLLEYFCEVPIEGGEIVG